MLFPQSVSRPNPTSRRVFHALGPAALSSAATAGVVLLMACGSLSAQVYDSGWAVASPHSGVAPAHPAPSVLGPSGIRVDRVVSRRVLEKIQLPEQEESLEWRPLRVAQRPKQAGPSGPLPLKPPTAQDPSQARDKATLEHAFEGPGLPNAKPAPESQAPPVSIDPSTSKSASDAAPHKPAPFAAVEPRPLNLNPVSPQRPTTKRPQEITLPAERPQTELHAPTKSASKPSTAPQASPQDAADQRDQEDELVVIEDKDIESSKNAAEQDDIVVIEDQPQPTAKGATTKAPKSEQPKRISSNTNSAKTFQTPKEIEQPQRPLRPLTRNEVNLRNRLRSVLSYYYRRPLNSEDHDAWEVMHHMLPYGLYGRVQDGGRNGKPVTAVGYLCFNKPCKRYQMLYVTPEGNLDVRVGVGMQGHKGQLLSMLAQCKVSPDYPMRVEGQEFTIRDLIAAEQLTCYARTELSFKLIGLMQYLPSDATWVNDRGETWDFPKLIADERTQKINGVACGGNHRLTGLGLAAKKRWARGEPLDGEWLEASKFVEQYQNYAFRLQNRDGSLSTEWFRGPGDEEDIDRRIRTTGHTLEWLVNSLPEEQLGDRRVVSAVNYLTSLLVSNTQNGWEIGPLAHALNALALYDQKVFVPHDTAGSNQVAGKSRGSGGTPNYRILNSPVSESYYYVEARYEERVKRENSGLGALFGLRPSSSRRSR